MYIGRLIIAITIFLLVILIGVSFWWYQTTAPSNSSNEDKIEDAILSLDFKATEQLFIAKTSGDNIAKIVVKAGQNSGATSSVVIGNMDIDSNQPALADETLWSYKIPAEPISGISNVFIVGLDKNNQEIDIMNWNVSGVVEVSEILWPISASKEYDLAIGEVFNFEELEVKLIDVPQDSRCPINVECVHAGYVTADLEISLSNKTQILSLKSIDGKRRIGDYYINISKVSPDKKDGVTLSISDYLVSFLVSSAI
ncbi:MAG: hypothetical protein QG609_250 [Patescibacteria group bacterium]|nr:hypothetical protein [Patescibacteria group bacterium]